FHTRHISALHARDFLLVAAPPSPHSSLSPYTTLFRPGPPAARASRGTGHADGPAGRAGRTGRCDADLPACLGANPQLHRPLDQQDRKSTRLHSSHVKISYAVFCLKTKSTDTFITVTHT